MREKVQINGMMDLPVTMSEGNPGALSVIIQLMQGADGGVMKLLSLDDMNIRGSQIWVGYKDYCGEDIDKFKAAIHERDAGMVETINAECLYGDFQEKAVTSGASFVRT